uniref:RRM domain-containing protein n=1 Tax=Meloidogyne incognita TaxID=6306 RepID=A0A914LDU2_MELIC
MPSFYHLWRKYPALSFIVRTYAPVVVRHLRIDICGSKKSARKIWFAKVSLPLGFPGLRDIRQITDRTDIAFVEFSNENEATNVKKALNNFKITPTHAMRVEYAKK